MTTALLPLAVHEFIWGRSPEDLFQMGGPVMWPLLIGSVLAIAIVVERLIVFASVGAVPQKLGARAAEALEAGDETGARQLLEGKRHPAAKVLARQLKLKDRPRDERAQIIQREGGLVIERLEKRLSPLLLIAQSAPLLGLLGTVSGLVSSFWKLEQINGPVEPSDLAAGIWAALLTTVFGLVVGIPASVGWHLLQDRADAFARHLGFAVTRLEEAIGSDTEGDDKTEDRPATSAAETVEDPFAQAATS